MKTLNAGFLFIHAAKSYSTSRGLKAKNVVQPTPPMDCFEIAGSRNKRLREN